MQTPIGTVDTAQVQGRLAYCPEVHPTAALVVRPIHPAPGAWCCTVCASPSCAHVQAVRLYEVYLADVRRQNADTRQHIVNGAAVQPVYR